VNEKPKDGSLAWEHSLCQNPTYLKGLLKSLTGRAAKGDKAAAAQVAKILADHPELKAAVRQIEDLSVKVETAWVKALAGSDELAAEAVRTEIAALKAELLRPDSGLLHRTLVEVYLVSYMAHQRAAAMAAQPAPNSAVAAARDRQLESAQRRLARATKELAQFEGKHRQGLTVPSGVRLFDTSQRPPHARRGRTRGDARRP
jgi:hypothetical protein